MDILAATFKPSLDGKFNFTSLFTVLVGNFTICVTNGLYKTSPDDLGCPFNFPKDCLTPTCPGLMTENGIQEVTVSAITVVININFFMILFFV